MKNVRQAVALKYPEGIEAPVIAAKGIGAKAEKILKIAEQHNIPIEENSGLVDLLGLEDIGAIVPENTWKILAEIFAFIMENE